MSETTMYYECSADGCTTDTPKPCGSRCHARLVQPSTEPITEDTPTPPDAEAVARANIYLDRTMSTDADLDAYREAVERRVRAECLAIVLNAPQDGEVGTEKWSGREEMRDDIATFLGGVTGGSDDGQ